MSEPPETTMADTWNDTGLLWVSWNENLKRWVLAAQGITLAGSATPTMEETDDG